MAWPPTRQRRRLNWVERLWWLPTAASAGLLAIHPLSSGLGEMVGTLVGSLFVYAGASTWWRGGSARRRIACLPFAVHDAPWTRRSSSVCALEIAFAQPLEGLRVEGALLDIQSQIPYAVAELVPERNAVVITRLPWGTYDLEAVAVLLDGWGRQLHATAPISAVVLAWF